MKKFLSIALALCLVLSISVTAFAIESTTYGTGATATGVTAWDGTSSTSQNITVPATFDGSGFDDMDVTANYFVVLRWGVTSTLTYTITSSDFSWVVYDSADKDSKDSNFSGTAAKAGYTGNGTWSGTATVSVSMQNWSNRPIKGAFSYADMTVANSTDTYVKKDIDTSGVRTMGTDIELASAAENVEVYAAADANNHVDSDTVTAVTINAGTAGSPTGMTGAISDSNAVIGTLTVTISDNTPASTPEP